MLRTIAIVHSPVAVCVDGNHRGIGYSRAALLEDNLFPVAESDGIDTVLFLHAADCSSFCKLLHRSHIGVQYSYLCFKCLNPAFKRLHPFFYVREVGAGCQQTSQCCRDCQIFKYFFHNVLFVSCFSEFES